MEVLSGWQVVLLYTLGCLDLLPGEQFLVLVAVVGLVVLLQARWVQIALAAALKYAFVLVSVDLLVGL